MWPLRGSRRPSLAALVPDTLTHGPMPQREMAWVRFPDGTRKRVERVDKADAQRDLDDFVAHRAQTQAPEARHVRQPTFNEIIDEWFAAQRARSIGRGAT